MTSFDPTVMSDEELIAAGAVEWPDHEAHIVGVAQGLNANPDGEPADSSRWQQLQDEALNRGWGADDYLLTMQHHQANQ